MGFCVAAPAEALPERGRLGWSYLLLLSVMENWSSGRKEGVDGSRRSPEMVYKVNHA